MSDNERREPKNPILENYIEEIMSLLDSFLKFSINDLQENPDTSEQEREQAERYKNLTDEQKKIFLEGMEFGGDFSLSFFNHIMKGDKISEKKVKDLTASILKSKD